MSARITNREVARATLVEALVATGEADRSAFDRLYTLTCAKLFGICFRICQDRQAAEDVLHEVYLIVWKKAAAYEPGRSSPITWLATIARNRSIDWRRSLRGSADPIEAASGIQDDRPSVVEGLLARESDQALYLCLDKLGVEQRDAIRTAFFDGLTYAELAQSKAVPLGTIKSRVRRGLIQLKDCLDNG